MRSLVVGLVVSSALVACGDIPAVPDAGSDAGIDAPTDPCAAPQLSVDEFFTCVSQTFCDVVSDCLGGDVAHLDCDDLPLVVFDELYTPAFKRLLANSDQAGRAQWNPTAAATCIANLRDAQCELFSKGIGDEIFQCGAIVGNVLDGAPCQGDFECATPGAVCENPAGGAPACGTQVCRKPAATDQSCADLPCGPGDHCVNARVGSTSTSTCRTGAAGAVCDRSDDCDRDLFCNGGQGDQTAAGICTASKPVGSICSEDRECRGELLCVGETDTATGFCTDVRVAGAQCDAIMGCFGGQQCVGNQNQLGTCTPAAGAGDACATSQGIPFCGFTLACDAGTCAVAGRLGDPCTSNAGSGVLASNPNGCSGDLFCSTEIVGGSAGTCEAPRADGQACRSDDHCTSGFCGSNQLCAPIPVCF